jgi:protein-S-isoprenylcysteine O-methyltransferase Ste14
MIEPIVVTLFPAAFLTALFAGGALLRRKNVDMDGEPPINTSLFYLSKYSIVLIWCAMVLRGWGIRQSFIEAPNFLRWVSLFLWVLGFLLLIVGRSGLGTSFRIGSPKESTSLVVGGPFRFSRNPMYVGIYATVLASIFYTLNPIVLLLGIFVIAVHHGTVLAEEQYLLRVFGAEYIDYSSRVRRYL